MVAFEEKDPMTQLPGKIRFLNYQLFLLSTSRNNDCDHAPNKLD